MKAKVKAIKPHVEVRSSLLNKLFVSRTIMQHWFLVFFFSLISIPSLDFYYSIVIFGLNSFGKSFSDQFFDLTVFFGKNGMTVEESVETVALVTCEFYYNRGTYQVNSIIIEFMWQVSLLISSNRIHVTSSTINFARDKFTVTSLCCIF